MLLLAHLYAVTDSRTLAKLRWALLPPPKLGAVTRAAVVASAAGGLAYAASLSEKVRPRTRRRSEPPSSHAHV